MTKNWIVIAVSAFCLTAGWASVHGAEIREVTLMCHDSFSVSKEIVSAFETAQQAKILFLKSGDAGAALNQAILSKNNPLADVFFGVDTTFFSRALRADIFEPFASPLLADIPEHLRLDPQNRLLPVDFGDVCLNYDKKWFAEKGIRPPESLEDLLRPEYRGLTVVENPATSSPGLAFLLTTVSRFGEKGFSDYWKSLRGNEVLAVDGWKQAYWGHFTAASKGKRPIVVSYASSPPAEVHYAEKKPEDAPTAAVTGNASAFRQIEFAGILKGAKNPDLARKLIDFMLDVRFQEDIPLQMFMFPANASAKLPEVFVKYAVITEKPAVISPEAIDKGREQWIQTWTETVLR
ncbi:MAG: thiamine ABC transporter substrate-binding protein [Desulfobacterales bacterium]